MKSAISSAWVGLIGCLGSDRLPFDGRRAALRTLARLQGVRERLPFSLGWDGIPSLTEALTGALTTRPAEERDSLIEVMRSAVGLLPSPLPEALASAVEKTLARSSAPWHTRESAAQLLVGTRSRDLTSASTALRIGMGDFESWESNNDARTALSAWFCVDPPLDQLPIYKKFVEAAINVSPMLVTQHLVQWATHHSVAVRLIVLEALESVTFKVTMGSIVWFEILKMLSERLLDEDEDVRRVAIRFGYKLSAPKLLDPLIQCAETSSPSNMAAAIKLCELIGGGESQMRWLHEDLVLRRRWIEDNGRALYAEFNAAFPTLLSALGHPNPDVAAIATRRLALFPERVLAPLVSAFLSPHRGFQRRVGAALAACGSQGVKALLQHINGGDDVAESEARCALQRVGVLQSIMPLLTARERPEETQRLLHVLQMGDMSALRGLDKIAQRTNNRALQRLVAFAWLEVSSDEALLQELTLLSALPPLCEGAVRWSQAVSLEILWGVGGALRLLVLWLEHALASEPLGFPETPLYAQQVAFFEAARAWRRAPTDEALASLVAEPPHTSTSSWSATRQLSRALTERTKPLDEAILCALQECRDSLKEDPTLIRGLIRSLL